jgi:hypothetical protein
MDKMEDNPLKTNDQLVAHAATLISILKTKQAVPGE